MKTKTRKVILITGGSSGIGLAAANALSARGHRVFVCSRHPFDKDGLTHICADVTDTEAVRAMFDRIEAEAGVPDILINNAGFGISGAIEFTAPSEAKRQFDVNFFGTVTVTHEALSRMRKAGGGRIVNLSSVAGVVPIPFQAFYSATKAAINSYTMALANEVRPYGITVTAVMPGDIRTGFTDARSKIEEGDAAYGGRISRSVASMEKDERSGMSPQTAGGYVARIALSGSKKPLHSIGSVYKACTVLMKLLPAGAANRLIYSLYAK